MRLDQQNRNILIDLIPKLYGGSNQQLKDFENLVRAIGQTTSLGDVPAGSGFNATATFLVDRADQAGWIRALVVALLQAFPRVELEIIRDALDRAAVKPTTEVPYDEVLLDSGRVFVNRRPLRNAVQRLVDPLGASVLLVDGEPQTGKTFSFYLLSHAATRRDFIVHGFNVSVKPQVHLLAEEVAGRMFESTVQLPAQGPESAERWAEKLADAVASAVQHGAKKRCLVFDEFPPSPPTETLSFCVRLARYADEELHRLLRVVLVKFPGELPVALDDVAMRDEAVPFTTTDMLAAMTQIALSRGWKISDDELKKKIDAFEALKQRTLRERFRFMKLLVDQLSASVLGAPD